MSTILKALRRLETEKSSAESDKPLREELTQSLPVVDGRTAPLVPMVALVLGLALGGGAIWLLQGNREQPLANVAAAPAAEPLAEFSGVAGVPPVAVAPAVAEPRVAVAPAVGEPRVAAARPSEAEIRPVVPAPARADARRPTAEAVEVVKRPVRQPRIRGLAAPEALAPAPNAPVVTARAEVQKSPEPPQPLRVAERSEPKPPAGRTPRAQSQRAPVAHNVAQAVTPLAPLRETPDETPESAMRDERAQEQPLDELPIAEFVPRAAPARESMPEVVTARTDPAPRVVAPPPAPPARDAPLFRVAKTFWHPISTRREALIGLGDATPKRLREGDAIEDFTVTEIQPAAVLFERDGERIRRELGAK